MQGGRRPVRPPGVAPDSERTHPRLTSLPLLARCRVGSDAATCVLCDTSAYKSWRVASIVCTMDFARPMLAITPTLDGDVLAALAGGDVELSGRQLARHVGYGSTEGIRRAADRLVTQGTVLRRAVGGAHLYRLNREHLAAAHIEALAHLRGLLIERLRELLAAWPQPAKIVILFGSVARGEATAASDLDLLIIRAGGVDADSEAWREQLGGLQRSVTAWTGNDTRVIEYAEDELASEAEPLLAEAIEDGIELFGSRRQLKRLIMGSRRG